VQVLTVPNWSFGRDSDLLARFGGVLDHYGVEVHYLLGDVDHNRTVSAFSGHHEIVARVLLDLCELAFPRIDLNRHTGVHPRIGALDVLPLVAPWGCEVEEMEEWVDIVASEIADRFDVPVFLYEKSEKGRHEADLPALRKGGFGGLLGRELDPDFGPREAHPRLGATVLGWRDFLIAMNIDLDTTDLPLVRRLAKKVRTLRSEGDPRFLGVRALGLPLPSRDRCQLSLNLTLPDLTHVDPIIEWVQEQCVSLNVRIVAPELIGVIRDVDMEHATRLPVCVEQVVKTR
jgi:glutamate formiminotransferase